MEEDILVGWGRDMYGIYAHWASSRLAGELSVRIIVITEIATLIVGYFQRVSSVTSVRSECKRLAHDLRPIPNGFNASCRDKKLLLSSTNWVIRFLWFKTEFCALCIQRCNRKHFTAFQHRFYDGSRIILKLFQTYQRLAVCLVVIVFFKRSQYEKIIIDNEK